MSSDEILMDAEERMDKAVEVLRDELRGVRTGRASPALVDSLRVDYYGSPTPLKQLASISAPEAQSLLILDLDKCTRCDACVKACADAHDGVTRLIREGLRFENYLVATSCRQCWAECHVQRSNTLWAAVSP